MAGNGILQRGSCSAPTFVIIAFMFSAAITPSLTVNTVTGPTDSADKELEEVYMFISRAKRNSNSQSNPVDPDDTEQGSGTTQEGSGYETTESIIVLTDSVTNSTQTDAGPGISTATWETNTGTPMTVTELSAAGLSVGYIVGIILGAVATALCLVLCATLVMAKIVWSQQASKIAGSLQSAEIMPWEEHEFSEMKSDGPLSDSSFDQLEHRINRAVDEIRRYQGKYENLVERFY